jgi:hypothetical protein
MNRISIDTLFKVFLTLYVVFMMTVLKFSLGLTSISSIFNGLIFVVAVFVILYGLVYSKLALLPSVLLISVFFLISSSLLNLFVNWSPLGAQQVITYILPWLALMMVLVNREVACRNYRSIWVWGNNFFVFICFVGLCEYVAIYILGYRPPIIELDTGMGEYYVGYSTLFQKIPNLDIPYFRFQGPFGESGDLAMWASVFIVYNLLRRQYAYAAVLAVAIFGAFSPSVFISLFVAFLIYAWSRGGVIKPIVGFFTCVAIAIFWTDIISLYHNIMEMKVTSLGSRAEANLDFIDKLPFLLNAHPLGVPFFESSNEKIASGVGFSASYGAIGTYMMGGLMAFLIYIAFTFYLLFLSVYKIFLSKLSLIENELYMYYFMLFTYTVQRATLFDYAIFPFLFAPLFFEKVVMNTGYDNLKKTRNLVNQ